MEQLTFQFRFGELKVGDKVEILDKSIGDPLPSWGWEKGEIAYIGKIASGPIDTARFDCISYFLKRTPNGRRRDGRFAHNDLRRKQ